MHDLSIALRSRGACSAFSSGLITVVAAISLAALPCFSAASFINVKYGSPWALIRADTDLEGFPTQISIGMFRICYASPGPSCLAFNWGLSMSKYSFQGADQWIAVLPPINATKAWPLLSAVAFFVTFMSAFVHCLNNAPVFVISTGVITLSINIAYLSFTAYLFFSLRTSIQKYTEYEPSPVLITTAVLGTSLALVLIAAFLTIFTKKRGDTLYVRHFDDNESEGNKDTEKGPIYHSEDIASNLSKDVNHSEEPGYVEKVKRLEDWRDVIESEEEEDRNSEEAATVEMQLRFISNPKYDPFKPEEVEKRRKVELKKPGADLTQNAKNNKGRNPLISKEPKAPHPEDEFHEVH